MSYEIGKKIGTGRKAVAVAGTPEPLVDHSIQCFMVLVSADLGNTSPVVVGNNQIVATPGSQKGVVLVPGNPPASFIIDDISKVYVDAQTSGDAVCFVYFQT